MMSYNTYPQYQGTAPAQQQHDGRSMSASTNRNSVVAMGLIGAMVGASAAAAGNIRKVRQGEMNNGEAVSGTVREAAGAGLATAAGAAVADNVGNNTLLSTVVLLAVATGAKYAWNSFMEKDCAAVEVKKK
jgi:hypothetical protein